MSQDEDLRRRLKNLLKMKTLNEVKKQDFTFASLGTLSRIRDGYILKTNCLRDAFGLTTLVSVASCPNCGGSHTQKCSPKKNKGERMLVGSRKDIATMIAYIKFFKSAEAE